MLPARYKRRFEVGINPGSEQNDSVGAGTTVVFPDAVLYSPEKNRKILGVVEVETIESINHLEAMAEWAVYSRLKLPFHLYVPVAALDVARQLSSDHQVVVAEIWSFDNVGDQVRFTLVHKGPEVEVVGMPAPRPVVAKPAKPAVEPKPAAKPAEMKPAMKPATKAAAKPAKPAPPAKPQRPVKTEQPGKSEKPPKSEKPARLEKTAKATKSAKPVKPATPAKPASKGPAPKAAPARKAARPAAKSSPKRSPMVARGRAVAARKGSGPGKRK